ncbi:hypothetical protein FGE12_15520 [Aggregicoccus sp. 17bor-14]|uniref:hypothetical protein n=1 Tax=Myxococcaceae TaxID=31 RepID=UPI00129C4698|nr:MULTISPECIES: hypothetical protein [Myxococcaceae]MBF5043807.1 hypothetical protein [Simulacricoccus sp. 17bor-14]MRI89560.1 hypothetical protein [Aggregicoccus sp. 17bor-14]
MKGAGFTAALPFVGALGAYAALRGLHGGLAEETIYFIVGILAVGSAALGSFVAALTLDAGDYMRRPWALMGTCYGLLALNALLFRTTSRFEAQDISALSVALSGVLLFVGNAASVWGTVQIARAYRVAGLDLQVPPALRWLAVSISLAIALALVGELTLDDLKTLAGGNLHVLPSLASNTGDVVSLTLIAPILLTAFALRGGNLGWPWSLLAFGSLGWLLYGAAPMVGTALGVDESLMRAFGASLRTFACLSQMSAGLLQALVVMEPERPLPAYLLAP